ncbi:MAG: CBS domain-containing protein [Nitrospinae bacterium]|nr:CBS domain-containing protein [Nitrospinota bacterium]
MTTAKDIMTANPVTVPPHISVRELAAIFVEKKISGAPVVDASGKLLGIVTESDLVDQHKHIHLPTVVTLFDAVLAFEGNFDLQGQIKKMLGSRVEDIMSPKVVTVNEDTPLEDVATIMSEKKVHLLPVVRGGGIVGIIGKLDIIKAIIR